MPETANRQAVQSGDLLGQTVTFDGEYMGTVIDDRVRPVCWHSMPQRVLTLDNGHKLRWPFEGKYAIGSNVLRGGEP